jgi:AhpD family alkylhydroperoxidase
MPTTIPVEYDEADPEVQAVYDDIMASRGIEQVPNFWRTLGGHPAVLKRTWGSLKEIMAPGALEPVVKEMIAVAISASNGCEYCIRSHTALAKAKGMSDEMHGELLAVIGMFNETNALVNTMQVEVDETLK